MALNNYRRVDIILDTANDKVDWQSPLNANTGEYNSRNLRVQLTNGGVVEPQTANLYFGFRHVETGESGVVSMNKVDSNRGIYEVYYPREMMAKEGIVICAVKIVDTVNGTNHINLTANFTVNVARSAIDDSMEVPENSLRVFDKMVIDVMVHERRVTVIESTLNELVKEYGDLKTWLEANAVTQSQINELTRQNAQIAFNAKKIDRLAKTASLYDVYENLYVTDDHTIDSKPPTSISLYNMINNGKILRSAINKDPYIRNRQKILTIEGSGVLLGVNLEGEHYIVGRLESQYNKNTGDENDSGWSRTSDSPAEVVIMPKKYYFEIQADGNEIIRWEHLQAQDGIPNDFYSGRSYAAKIRDASFYSKYYTAITGGINYFNKSSSYSDDDAKHKKDTYVKCIIKNKENGLLSTTQLAGIPFNNKLEIIYNAYDWDDIIFPIVKPYKGTYNYLRTVVSSSYLNTSFKVLGLAVLVYPKQ